MDYKELLEATRKFPNCCRVRERSPHFYEMESKLLKTQEEKRTQKEESGK